LFVRHGVIQVLGAFKNFQVTQPTEAQVSDLGLERYGDLRDIDGGMLSVNEHRVNWVGVWLVLREPQRRREGSEAPRRLEEGLGVEREVVVLRIVSLGG
jgi:hypothetical protein